MSLKHSDVQNLSTALRELYAHTDSKTLPHCIVRLLHRLIAADSAVYNSFDFRTGEMHVVHDHGPDGDRYLPALNAHIQEHPLLLHMRTHWKDGAATLADVISHRQLRDQLIYSEFLHPLRIERQLGLLVEDRNYGVAAVGLQRDGKDFSQRDKQVLTLLQPHIIQACKNAADITEISRRGQDSEQALQIAQTGVVRLTARLKIEWSSALAANWFKLYFPSDSARLADNDLPHKLESRLQHHLKKQPQPSVTSWQETSLHGVLSFRWLPGEQGRSHLIVSEQRRNSLPQELESLGLSKREAEVLHWIVEGKSNDFIARILSTSKRTVDKQVENVLRKLGVESRVAAAVRAERHRPHK